MEHEGGGRDHEHRCFYIFLSIRIYIYVYAIYICFYVLIQKLDPHSLHCAPTSFFISTSSSVAKCTSASRVVTCVQGEPSMQDS